MSKLLNLNQAYTFSKIFELKIEPDDLVTEFGYTLERTRLNLPQYQGELDRLEELRARIEAKREDLEPLMGILVQALIA